MKQSHPPPAALVRPASVQDAAGRFGVHPITIRRMVARGDIAGYRFGPRIVRVDLDELERAFRPIPTVGGRDG